MPEPLLSKKFNDLRNALDQLEGALFGCAAINWEELEEMFEAASDCVIIHLAVRKDELFRLKRALDKANSLINDETYGKVY